MDCRRRLGVMEAMTGEWSRGGGLGVGGDSREWSRGESRVITETVGVAALDE